MAKSELKFHKPAWNKLVKEIVDTECVKRMHEVADACNADLGETGYMVSTEGDKPLSKHGYRATCITATWAAMYDSAHNQTLIRNMHLAGGD